MFNTKEAALYLGLSPYYLRNMRQAMHNHEGPKYTKEKHPRGTICLYSKEALDLWAKNHVRRTPGGKIRKPYKRKRKSEFLEGDYIYV
jgi:hypothetical protein